MRKRDKAKISYIENAAYAFQTFRLPIGKNWHDKRVQQMYHKANIIRARCGLPPKSYKLLTHNKGVIEVE